MSCRSCHARDARHTSHPSDTGIRRARCVPRRSTRLGTRERKRIILVFTLIILFILIKPIIFAPKRLIGQVVVRDAADSRVGSSLIASARHGSTASLGSTPACARSGHARSRLGRGCARCHLDKECRWSGLSSVMGLLERPGACTTMQIV
jgi:hypothetical protein